MEKYRLVLRLIVSACICEHHKALRWDILYSLTQEVICFLDCLVFATFISERCNRKWNYPNRSFMLYLLSGRYVWSVVRCAPNPLCTVLSTASSCCVLCLVKGSTFSPRRPGGPSVPVSLAFLLQVTPVWGVLLEKVRLYELDKELLLFHLNNDNPFPICRSKFKSLDTSVSRIFFFSFYTPFFSLSFFFFLAVPQGMQALSSPTWDWTHAPCIGSMES